MSSNSTEHRPARRMLRIAAAGITLLLSAGCAYYSTTSGFLPPHIRSIAVPSFENRSYEYGIAENLNEAVINRFMANSRLQVVNRKNADSVLEVVIVDVDKEPFTLGQQELAEQYKLVITVAARYTDVVHNEIIWQNERMTGWETYDAAGAMDHDTALQGAVDKLAADIFNQIIAGW